MDGSKWEKVKELFDAALGRAAEERAAFVREAAGDDAEVVAEVMTMLSAHLQAGGFLDAPPALPEPDLTGRRIGPYRVVGQAGQGGMGTVYRAVRDDEAFERTVAIKVVRGGSEEVQRRLEQETRLLGRLQHPNIATILDGGRTEEGLPYLVMDFVEGQPIDVHCRTRRLGVRGRLELFRTVCAAVSYAHQNLIVHRDLKPANILVTDDGQPRLLDFGIAKLLAGGIPGEETTLTVLPMMTPAYASPEQVRGVTVTTATDVYSLGVVLYELLTGARPYVVDAGSLEEMVKQICDTEPVPPSVAVKQAPGGAPARPGELAGDLDTIVLEALQKSPMRRYSSVAALAEDVHRYLAGLPILARPDSLGYRARKFVGRHRAGVAAAALVLASLIAGVVTTYRQARIADEQRARAEGRFADLRDLARAFIVDVDNEIRFLAGATAARRKIVEKGLLYLDRLQSEAEDDVDLLAEVARGYNRIGDILGNDKLPNLGDTAGARASYEKAEGLARRAIARARRHQKSRYALWQALLKRGGLEARVTGVAEGLRKLDEALAVVDESLALDPGYTDGLRERGVTLSEIAKLEQARGNLPAARARYQEAYDAAYAFRAANPKHPEATRDVFYAEIDLATILFVEDPRKAVAPALRAVALAEAGLAAEPDNEQSRRDLMVALNHVARALGKSERAAESLAYLERSQEIGAALRKADPADVQLQRDRVVELSMYGRALMQVGRLDEALASFREAEVAAEALAKAHPAERRFRRDVGLALGQAGEVEAKLGRREDAIRTLERSIAMLEELAKSDPNDAETRALADQVRERLVEVRGK